MQWSVCGSAIQWYASVTCKRRSQERASVSCLVLISHLSRSHPVTVMMDTLYQLYLELVSPSPDISHWPWGMMLSSFTEMRAEVTHSLINARNHISNTFQGMDEVVAMAGVAARVVAAVVVGVLALPVTGPTFTQALITEAFSSQLFILPLTHLNFSFPSPGKNKRWYNELLRRRIYW